MKITPNHHLAPLEDQQLARQACTNPAAFGELYQRHFLRVYRYHVAHTGDYQESQDLTAQTFLAALEGIHSYRLDGSFGAWLLGIARNMVALHFRRRKPIISIENADQVADTSPLPETHAGFRLQLGRVISGLRQLTPERAEALTLCVFGDLNAQEAGLVLGKSEAAVKMLVSRGLNDLREMFTPSLEEEKE